MLAVIVVATIAMTETAGADNKVGNWAVCDRTFSYSPPLYREQTEVCNTDNGNVFYHFANVGPRTRTAIYSTMAGSWGTISNITDFITSDPHNSTDIYYEFKSLDHLDQEGRGAAVGVSWCLETHTNYTCDHGHIAFDPATNGGIGDYTDTELKSIACHETGHALGQTHPPTNSTSTYGCMVTNTLYPMVHGHNVNDIENNWHY